MQARDVNARERDISRRRLVQGAAATALLAAAPRALAGRRPPSVAVFGGGVGGLTVAHELAERGFAVTVYERRAWGGKARSMAVPGSAAGGRRPLPAEHGPRQEFASYQHLPDMMSRIPFPGNANGVYDNLVEAKTGMVARNGWRANAVIPMDAQQAPPLTPQQGLDDLLFALQSLPAQDDVRVAQRLAVFLSSGQLRRHGQWEHQTWWDFLAADQLTSGSQGLWGQVFTRFASASDARAESARCAGEALESLLYMPLTGRGKSRILNLPSNEAWIDPWVTHLRRLGVEMRLGATVEGLEHRGGRISSATVTQAGVRGRVVADYYVIALPVERAARLWSPSLRRADPALEASARLTTRWMNGVQFYLRQPRPIANGPILAVDSPWGVAAYSQSQFWASRDFARDYGDGTAREYLSAFFSDQDAPGVLYRKPVTRCSPAEIAREVWTQLKAGLTKPGQTPVLTDDLLVRWHLDPGLLPAPEGCVSEDALWISRPGSFSLLPDAGTRIPNLVLSASWVRTGYINVDCMEAATEAGRRAANAVLERASSTAAPCTLFARQLPEEWAQLRQQDDERYRQGQANVFDTALASWVTTAR